jgi:ribonuclease P protein component
VLPKANRITRPEDFREVSRRARRSSGQLMLVQVLVRHDGGPSRAGFVVSKSVGGAVRRNRVRRQLRASFAGQLRGFAVGRDVLVRALPSAESATWAQLNGELGDLMARSTRS